MPSRGLYSSGERPTIYSLKKTDIFSDHDETDEKTE